MDKKKYEKPALTFEQQLEKLEKRGLQILDKKNALYILSNLSYYRFSGYLYPFLEHPKTNHKFLKGSSFENAFNLYRFDRDLKTLIFYELEKIEIAIRTQLIYVLSHKFGPFWFENKDLFYFSKGHLNYYRTILKLKSECDRSDEVFIKFFKKKYSDPIPPSWIILEVVSFGSISSLYKLINPNGNGKREIANHFGLSEKVFESWLHTLVYIRNIIAHHSRLWNKELRINPSIPRKTKLTWLSVDILPKDKKLPDNSKIKNNRVYFILSMIAYLLQTINPETRFKSKLKELIKEYETINIYDMGFSQDWLLEDLWKE